MHPELTVVQGMDDAQVALVVHHDQVKKEGQKEEVGKDVHQEARYEMQRSIEAHARDER